MYREKRTKEEHLKGAYLAAVNVHEQHVKNLHAAVSIHAESLADMRIAMLEHARMICPFEEGEFYAKEPKLRKDSNWGAVFLGLHFVRRRFSEFGELVLVANLTTEPDSYQHTGASRYQGEGDFVAMPDGTFRFTEYPFEQCDANGTALNSQSKSKQ